MKTNNVGKMHDFLTSMEKYNVDVPFYVDNLYSDEDMNRLREIWKKGRSLKPIMYGPNEKHEQDEPDNMTRYRPKHIKNMSRLLLEFEMPKDIEYKLDQVAKQVYDGDIDMCHYNYIEYNIKFGEGNDPTLQPQIDGDENFVTLKKNMGGKI